MHHHINNLLPFFEHIGVFGYWVIFLASLFESLAFVGALIPGTIVVIFGGFLSAQGYLHFGDLVWFVTAGAIIGDGFSYYLGTKGTRFFKAENKFLKISHIERGENFFKKHGNKSVFLARFVGPLRPIIPFVAGLTSMDIGTFIFWNITSAVLWAVVNLSLGYFFGGALTVIETWSTRFGFFVAGLIVVGFILWFVIKEGRNLFPLIASFSQTVRNVIAHNPRVQKFASEHKKLVSFLRNRLQHRNFSGLPLTILSLAFVFAIFLFFGIAQDVLTSSSIIATDVRLEKLLLVFYDPTLIKIFLWITLLARVDVIIAATIICSVIFWQSRKKIYAYSLWLTVLGSQVFVFLGKILVHRARPDGFSFYKQPFFSFPSDHAALAVTFYGFVIYVILKEVNFWRHKTSTIFGGLLLIFLIGLSRLYLGVHFLSDVLGGYLIGLVWLIIGITVTEWYLSERHKN